MPDNTNVMVSKSRCIGLDLLKIIACLGVVGLHTIGKESSVINRLLYLICGFSIPIFFMVHGYFILNKKNLNYKYLLKKGINILCIVLVWNIIISVIYMVAGKQIMNPVKESVSELVLQEGFFFQFWYFGALLLIYFFTPLLKSWIDKKYVAPLIGFGLFCVIIDFASMIHCYRTGDTIQSYVKQPFRMWTWFFYYYCGGIIKNLLQTEIIEKYKKYLPYVVIILFAINGTYDYLIGYKIFGAHLTEHFYDNIFMILEVITLFVVFEQISISSVKIKKCIIMLASLIMGVFIIHTILLWITYVFHLQTNCMMNIAMWIGIFVMSLIISYIIKKIPIVRKLIEI